MPRGIERYLERIFSNLRLPKRPKHLRGVIKELKSSLKSPDLRRSTPFPITQLPLIYKLTLASAFGVDLLIPSLEPTARKTNYDYTKGQLNDLIDVIIEEKAKLFVCAVGVPPKEVVEKLHGAGIFVMNVSLVNSPDFMRTLTDMNSFFL